MNHVDHIGFGAPPSLRKSICRQKSATSNYGSARYFLQCTVYLAHLGQIDYINHIEHTGHIDRIDHIDHLDHLDHSYHIDHI